MDTTGAIRVDVSKLGDAGLERSVEVPCGLGFYNLLLFTNVPRGSLSLYAGSFFDFTGGSPLDPPFQIDWQLLHGSSQCVFDQNPIAGTTFVLEPEGLTREGLLFSVGGILADTYLLRGRVLNPALVTKVRTTTQCKFFPGLQSAALAITTGSMIG